MRIYFVFSAFTSRPFPYWQIIKLLHIYLKYVCMLPPSVNIINVNQILICTSQIQDILVCLNTLNGTFETKVEK